MKCHSNCREPGLVGHLLLKKINDLEGIQSHSYDNITRRSLLSDLSLIGSESGDNLQHSGNDSRVLQPGLTGRCVPVRKTR